MQLQLLKDQTFTCRALFFHINTGSPAATPPTCGNMSRHATEIARRTLRNPSLPPFTAASLLAPRLLFANSALPREGRLIQTTARALSNASYTYRHAATQVTKFQQPGPTTQVAGQLGLKNNLRWQERPLWYCAEHNVRLSQFQQLQRRWYSEKKSSTVERTAEAVKSEHGTKSATTSGAARHISEGSAGKTILERLPHIHRPSKDELLAAATGFWQRLGIRFKWLSIRSFRPFNHDEIGAFLSWIFYAHVLWVIIGTTTFISAAIWLMNTIFAQETLAGWVGNYLTKSSGVKVVFESAIVPAWGDGVITFKNVFVSRRPGQQGKKEKGVTKGSSTTAAAAAEAAMQDKSSAGSREDDGNYTQFDVTIGTVSVTLSFAKWFNGKGLLRDVEIKGVRGVIDRTHVHWDPELSNLDPKAWRHEHTTGDFEIDRFKMDDVLLTVYQPNKFRPFTVSVFNCELPRLRKQWLFYDFMSANNMSGSFDDSLFTVHPRQVHGHTGVALGDLGEDEAEQWKKHSRLRIDGLNIDHLNRGVEGPFSWITEGNVDIVADVMIPNDEDGIWQASAKAMSEFYNHMEATVQEQVHRIGHHDREHATQASSIIQNADSNISQPEDHDSAAHRFLVMDISVHLNDVRASVPLFTRDLSYINQTLVRPIVAYINSRSSTFIPIHCRVIKRQNEFDGSWTIFDSGLLDDLSRETYEAFVRDIGDSERRMRRMKRVGFWTLQLAAQALFVGLAGQLA